VVAAITLERVHKTYPNGHVALRDAALTIADGEFTVLVGPSGCGKSTLLRVIAGLETPDTGRVLIGGEDVTHVGPQWRDLAMVFQSYALYPHMTVRENLAYGLRVRKLASRIVDERLGAVAEALELAPLLDRKPAQLSGGQRQRVALGRAMVREPRAFLFDEPLSNLDPALRGQARAELLRLHRRLRTTIVYVTHDQEEAMTLADQVAVMRAGVIEQTAAPMDVYGSPANTFVARFIGSPAMNLIDAPIPGVWESGDALLGIRPHDIVIEDVGPARATVDLVELRGHDAVVHLTLLASARPEIVAVTAVGNAPSAGTEVSLRFRDGALHRFDRGSGVRVAP
jgi:ABC-type sugar transport system ATPase subunit